MEWRKLWAVLRVVSEHAPAIIQIIQQVAEKDAKGKKG